LRHLIITFTFIFYTGFVQSQTNGVDKITLTSFGELGEHKFVFTKKKIKEYQRAVDVVDSISINITNKDWDQVISMLTHLNLDSIQFFHSPTDNRIIDGDWYRSIRIDKNDEYFETPYYDSSFPNSKIRLLDSILEVTAANYSKINWNKLYLAARAKEKQNYQEPVYQIVDIMPQFNGGVDSLSSFVNKKLENLELKHGKAFIEFVITKTGNLENIRLLKADNEYFGNYAVEIIKTMPNWIPAVQNGNPVNVKIILPIEKKYP
jgi:hypothetical protein